MAPKKVPIDVKREPDVGQEIDIKFGGEVVKIPSWRWKLEKPISLTEIKKLRLCLYGKGVVRPWDECEGYRARFPYGVLACQLEHFRCPHEMICRKQKVSYIY